MKNNQRNLSNESGMALISVALFVMVMGVLMFSAVFVLKTRSTVQNEQKNIDHSITVQEAIENFVAINGRYPCPAVIDARPDTPQFAIEARNAGGCTTSLTRVTGSDGSTPVFIGAVPVRTLKIPEVMIADGNKKRYVFAVSGNMAQTSANTQYDQGVITILDRAGGTSITTPANSAIYALISPGKDNRGAYDISGIASQNSCPSVAQNADAHENCDFNDAVFVSKSEKISGDTVADYTATVAFAANPTAFDWSVEPWSGCGPIAGQMPCFNGEQTRAISCVGRNGDVSSNPTVDCAHTPRPAPLQTCALGPCRWEGTCPPPPPPSYGGGGGDSGGHSYNSDTGEMENTGSAAEN